MSETTKINRGLKGVYFERSGVSDIDGAAGELSYRGYSIHDLAAHPTFEEVCYLLIYGDLPTEIQLQEFDARLKSARTLPPAIHDIIAACKDVSGAIFNVGSGWLKPAVAGMKPSCKAAASKANSIAPQAPKVWPT